MLKESCNSLTPILFICYNRLDYVEKTLPLLLNKGKVYICSEGYNNELEKRGVNEVRSYLHRLDQEGDHNFIIWERDKNYGCEQNILDAINWVSSLEEDFIVCEEDVILTDSFFEFIENNKQKVHFNGYSCVSKVLYNCNSKDCFQFNPHGWYIKSEIFKDTFTIDNNFKKEEFIHRIIKEIHSPTERTYKALYNNFLNNKFYWDEVFKYNLYFKNKKILYFPSEYSTHIGKISSNQHGFIWLEDGTFVRNN